MAWVATALLHGMLIVGLVEVLQAAKKRSVSKDQLAVTWLQLERVTPRAISNTDERPSEKPHSSDSPLPSQPTDTRDSVASEPTPPIDTPNRTPEPIDWHAQGVMGAASALRSAEAREKASVFDQRTARPSQAPAAAEPPSIFTQPKHQLGAIDENHRGDPIVWLSPNCYFELDKRIDPDVGRVTVESMPQQICVIGVGKKAARGDLFDHLKKPKCSADVNDAREDGCGRR